MTNDAQGMYMRDGAALEPHPALPPAITSSDDPVQLRAALDSTFELFVRERAIVKELAAVVRDLLDGCPTEDERGRARNLLAKVPQ